MTLFDEEAAARAGTVGPAEGPTDASPAGSIHSIPSPTVAHSTTDFAKPTRSGSTAPIAANAFLGASFHYLPAGQR